MKDELVLAVRQRFQKPIALNVGGLAMPDIETMKHKMICSMAGSDQTDVTRLAFKGAAVRNLKQ